MQKGKLAAIILALIVAGVGSYAGLHYLSGNSGPPMIVYAADAYVQETNFLLGGYHNATGTSTVDARGGGSYTDAREIGQGDPANAFVSVALEAYNQSYLESRYSGWAIAFASDQLVLAYSNATDKAEVNTIIGELSSALSRNSSAMYDEAFQNLTSGSVKVGISDPGSDPAGLRGWISLEIAGQLYADGNQSYYMNRLVANGALVNSSSAAQLVAPLVTGQIQFLFIYKSAAISKGLNYVELPNQTNFGDPALSAFYSSFSYNTTNGVSHGSTIFLYITALAGNGAMTNATLDFVAFATNHSSEMAQFGLKPLSTPVVYNNTPLPPLFQELLSSGKIRAGGRF